VGWGSTKTQFRNVKLFVSVVVLLVCGWGFASGFAVVWRWIGEVRKSNFGMQNLLLALLCCCCVVGVLRRVLRSFGGGLGKHDNPILECRTFC